MRGHDDADALGHRAQIRSAHARETHDTAKRRVAHEISLCMIERCVATVSDRRPRAARHSLEGGVIIVVNTTSIC
jgi:hypothetical protein